MNGYTKVAYLSLGSNHGDRAYHIERAIARLKAAGVSVKRRSALYETEPVGIESPQWFLNCVLEVETDHMPVGLLRLTQRIERELGRRPPSGPQSMARPIDIDLLFFGKSSMETPELILPHPRLAERRFVLEPLVELAPELRHPRTRQTVAEMLAALGKGEGAVRRWRR